MAGGWQDTHTEVRVYGQGKHRGVGSTCFNTSLQEGVKYKSVNTYSGWTAATRVKYQKLKVKIIKTTGKETLVERLPLDPAETEKKETKEAKETKEEKETKDSKEAKDSKEEKGSKETKEVATKKTSAETPPSKPTKHKTPTSIRKKSINEE